MMCNSIFRRVCFLAALALGGMSILSAQTRTTGTVVGTITDESKAVIPGAQVELTDLSSNATRSVTTNASGQYVFPDLAPGAYRINVSSKGFKTTTLAVTVEVAKSVLGDISLALGSQEQTVEVVATAQSLQTVDSSVGDVVGGNSIVELPTTQRRASQLLYLQVGAQTTFGTGGNTTGGGIAGARSDQNVFTMDGIDISEPEMGGIIGQIGPGMSVPVEAVEEFRGTSTNPNATLDRTGGGQFAFTTRRGSNDFHGAAYWYYQTDYLDANTWTQNTLKQPRSFLEDNRYGGRLGGPLRKNKTFFFLFAEGRQYPNSTNVSRTVPTASFRQGILRFPDAAGNIISYNLATSMQCGPSGNLPCDPRGIGMSPIISQLMSHYPAGNSLSAGDGYNTIGFIAPTDTSQSNDYVLGRIDHSISDNWRLGATYNWQQERVANSGQVNFDPTLTGGQPYKTLSFRPADPRLYTIGLTGVLRPNLINDFHAGYTQTGVPIANAYAYTQVPAAGFPISLSPSFLSSPGDPTSLGPQYEREDVYSWNDNLNWVKGKHNFVFGFNLQHENFNHYRNDQDATDAVPVAAIETGGSFTGLSANFRPPTCSAALTTNCLPSSYQTEWNQLYGGMLGIIDNVTGFAARNAQQQAQGFGQPIYNFVIWWHTELYAADAWRISPSLTLNYGLNYGIETPVHDIQNRQSFTINAATGQPIIPSQYIAAKEAAALQGQVYNPILAQVPADSLHRGIYPVQANPAPRAALAWQPNISNNMLRRIFGDRKTVVRGGYGLSFDRINVVGPVEYALQGNQLLGTSSSVQGPLNAAGQPYRVGVDGPIPTPPVSPTIPIPYVIPSRNPATGAPFGVVNGYAFDPSYKVGYNHMVNLTIQREFGNGLLLETGFIGHYGRRLPQGLDINNVPTFIKDMSGLSSETFAQAFDAVATQLRAGVAATAVTPQPWFENNLGANGTRTLAAAASSNFVSGQVGTLFVNQIDPKLMALGKSPVLSQQFETLEFISNTGFSNYSAGFVSFRTRSMHGLSLNANYTWAHYMDNGGRPQNSGSEASNAFAPGYDYGDALSDRRQTLSVYGVYELPFRKTNRLLGGWYASYVLTAGGGLPICVTDGGQQFGFSGQECAPAVAGMNYQSGRNLNVSGSGGVATTGTPASGGTGVNLFENPSAVFNNFRPILVSADQQSSRGVVRGFPFWNLDISIGKTTQLFERVRMKISADAFNLANFVLQSNPALNITSPAGFGVATTQTGNPSTGDFSGPRRIQLGLRFEF